MSIMMQRPNLARDALKALLVAADNVSVVQQCAEGKTIPAAITTRQTYTQLLSIAQNLHDHPTNVQLQDMGGTLLRYLTRMPQPIFSPATNAAMYRDFLPEQRLRAMARKLEGELLKYG